MDNIQKIDADAILAGSVSHHFLILLVTPDLTLSWTGNGFVNIDAAADGFMNMTPFRKADAIKEYHRAVAGARDFARQLSGPRIEAGRVDIVPLPVF